MSEAVTVSAVDVQRARLLQRLNQRLGATTAAYVVRIAEARPTTAAPVDGDAREPVNGVAHELPPLDRDPEHGPSAGSGAPPPTP